jgi:general secretion pathway protein J
VTGLTSAGRRSARRTCDCLKTRDRQSQPSTDGFALIDMLVALALVAVISSLMIVFLSQARSIIRITNATEVQTEIDAAANFLEGLISAAEPLPLQLSSQGNTLLLSGSHQRLELVGVQATGFGSSALRQIALFADKQDGEVDNDLMLELLPRRIRSANTTSDAEHIIVLSGDTRVEFEYLDGTALPSKWSTEWTVQKRLPAAIRFKIAVVRDGVSYSSNGLARLALASVEQAN